MIVVTNEPVTLLCAGVTTPQTIREALALAPILVAADGAAANALALGILPRAVIGDFDSIDDAIRAKVPEDRLFPVTEQDSTDFEKCLREIDAPLVLAVGCTGARIDHELATYSALFTPDRAPCIVIGDVDICFAAPPDLTLDLPVGSRLSLFPMAPVTGRSQGLRWPIEGLSFAPTGRVGTSNAVTGPVSLSFDAPGMLVILPRAALAAAMRALAR